MNPKHKKFLIAIAIALVTFLGVKYGLPKEFIDQAVQTLKEQDETDTGMVPVVVEEVPVVQE